MKIKTLFVSTPEDQARGFGLRLGQKYPHLQKFWVYRTQRRLLILKMCRSWIEAEQLENFSELAKLNIGAALRVDGSLVLTPGGKTAV